MDKVLKLTGVVVFAALAFGCAEKGPILLSLAYQPPQEQARSASATSVNVSPFVDSRGMAPSLLGVRQIPDGHSNDLVIQGTVSGIVSAAVKQALMARGLAVKDATWNLQEQGITGEGAGLLIGGEIMTLRIDTAAPSFTTKLKASVRMKVLVADVASKKIVRTVNVASDIEQEILYSREKLEQALSEALTAAINQIFKDEELGKRLQ